VRVGVNHSGAIAVPVGIKFSMQLKKHWKIEIHVKLEIALHGKKCRPDKQSLTMFAEYAF
jgi:hypothetical protein